MRSSTPSTKGAPAGGPRPTGLLKRALTGLVALATLTLGGAWLMHSSIDPAEERDVAHLPAVRSEALAEVKSWGYQLQDLDVAKAVRAPHDLLVVDEMLHGQGTERRGLTLSALRRKPDGGRRIVLAYLSIGEAESYRAYWRADWTRPSPESTGERRTDLLSIGATPARAVTPATAGNKIVPVRVPTSAAPAWLGRENPEWRGNYAVRYWHPEWRSLLTGSQQAAIDRLIAAGFDGVYLDRADVYSQWTSENREARAAMIDLVTHISAYAKAKDPEFIVALQNAEELLDNRKMRAALDLVAKEDLLHGIAGDGAVNAERDVRASLSQLKKAQAEGLPVLVVEYLEPGPAQEASRKTLAGHGFIPYFAPRSLNELRDRP